MEAMGGKPSFGLQAIWAAKPKRTFVLVGERTKVLVVEMGPVLCDGSTEPCCQSLSALCRHVYCDSRGLRCASHLGSPPYSRLLSGWAHGAHSKRLFDRQHEGLGGCDRVGRLHDR